MPRDPSGIYSTPVGTDGTPNFPIESTKYNLNVHDVETDLNAPRPIVAGGTGGNSADASLVNLSAEKAAQLVADYNTFVFMPGSFRSTAGVAGAPNSTATFSGVCYLNEALVNPPTDQNVTIEAKDGSDGTIYTRTKTAGVWGAWKTNRVSIYAAPFDALAYNGMQVNGSIEVSQELGTTGRTTSGYVCDGWTVALNTTASTLWAQSLVGGFWMGGMPARISHSVSVAQATLTASDRITLYHNIEGFRASRLKWGGGASLVQPLTIAFWSNFFRTGLYSISIRNAAGDRSYVTTYTHAVSNVAQYNVVTIPGCNDGVWKIDNGIGIQIAFSFGIGAGSAFIAPLNNQWLNGNYLGAAGQTNAVTFTSDSCSLSGLIVLPGLEAPSAARSTLIMRSFDQELVTCHRYFQFNKPWEPGIVQNAGTALVFTNMPTVPYRSAPATSLISTSVIFEALPYVAQYTMTGAAIDTAHMTQWGGNYKLTGSFTIGPAAGAWAAIADRFVKFDARL